MIVRGLGETGSKEYEIFGVYKQRHDPASSSQEQVNHDVVHRGQSLVKTNDQTAPSTFPQSETKSSKFKSNLTIQIIQN
jgi:hypothetical protein